MALGRRVKLYGLVKGEPEIMQAMERIRGGGLTRLRGGLG